MRGMWIFLNSAGEAIQAKQGCGYLTTMGLACRKIWFTSSYIITQVIYHYTTAIHVAIINCCGADGNSNVTLTAVAGVLVVALTPNAEVVTLEPRLRFEVVLLRLGFRFSHGQARFGTWSLMRFIVLPISARNQSGRICV